MKDISEPIFFIGVPRSGTTVSFEIFARHKDLGWPSNYTGKFPTMPFFGLVTRITDNPFVYLSGQKKQYKKVGYFNRLLHKPDEAYAFWNYYTGINFSRDFLLDTKAAPKSVTSLNRAAASIISWQGKKRFSAKITGPSRMSYLSSIFPDAKFVHIVRDGRAVVSSLLKVHFWLTEGRIDGPRWSNGLSDDEINEWRIRGEDAADMTAMQWSRIHEIAHQESIDLGPQRYIEVRYEDFMDKPHEIVDELISWTGLEPCGRVHEYIDSLGELKNMNEKYRDHLTKQQIDRITDIMSKELARLGYINQKRRFK